jgi:hypothetical protein
MLVLILLLIVSEYRIYDKSYFTIQNIFKMKNSILISIIALCSFVTACKDTEDTIKPTVSILSPTFNKIYKKGETVSIKASIQDANLDKVTLFIYSDEQKSVTYVKKDFDKKGQTDVIFEESWIASTTADSTKVGVTISAADKSGNITDASKIFFVKK